MAHQLTDEERAALTPEEIAAMEDDSFIDADDDPGAAEPDEDTDEQPNDDDNGGIGALDGLRDEQKPDDTAANDDTAGTEPPAEDPPQQEEPPAARAPYVPQEVQVPQETTDRLAAIGGELDALAEKFDDGDLTGREFRDAVSKLERERETLNEQVLTAKLTNQITNQITAQQIEQAWYSDVGAYLADHPEIGKSQLRMQAYDQVVRQVTGDAENSSLTNVQKLEKARKIWADELGIEATPKPKAADPKPAAQAAPPKPKNVPKTLSAVPAAQVEQTDDGEFGTIDRLLNSRNPHDVVKAEGMIQKLSPEKQQQYLAQ